MSTSRGEHLSMGFSSHPASRSQSQTRSGSPSANNSPVESSNNRLPFGLPPGITPGSKMTSNPRSGAGSPSHDMSGSGRLFSKRAREIQAQEGVPGMPLNLWGGPPTSGNSTPLRENIPESPTDGFPDYGHLPTPDSLPSTRRTRAGTVPSRFPGAAGNGFLGAQGLAKSARVTPAQSPFNTTPSPGLEPSEGATGGSALLSRLRAGSMPQRGQFAPLPGTSSPFGPSIFSSWNPSGLGRERGSTLASIASVGSNGPSSPSQSQYSKEGAGESDVHMRTLDYLGLAETPQQARAQLATPYIPSMAYTKQANRFRSYSVNNKDKYASEDEEDYDLEPMPADNPYMADVAAIQNQLAATNAAIQQHNMAIQAYANQTRPRAQTTGGVSDLHNIGSRVRNFMASTSGLSNSMAPPEMHLQDEKEYDELPRVIAGMNLGRSNSRNAGLLGGEEQGLEGPTSALWLGSVPTSTTTSTLLEMFKAHGPIVSARVLTHKNCGFVNYERVESAIAAKASLNGKEIFPGAGPIRINFAKPPSASTTPGHDGMFPSPSPVPFSKGQDQGAPAGASADASAQASSAASLTVPPLREMAAEILTIVPQFDANESDVSRISQHLDGAISFKSHMEEIPPIREPTHTRLYDAPKLRDIRKRIDNNAITDADIENIAMEMLPELSELSPDYLGNTVVQKLFERCSDPVRDAMLVEIAPHLAEVGIHKNGTWAAQKIIEVCRTPKQAATICEHLRPYTVPLFLDQYGNYVLQGCLKYGAPYNDFIYETMLSHMWEISQGRFGARAMRACLESHHANKNQQRALAAVIALRSVQLSMNSNAALLLTWFLDTCIFPQRRTVLAPRLSPHLALLCTHKVAYLTVLKVINQKTEPEARDQMLRAMFLSPNDQILEGILSDPTSCGALLVFKVLTTPFFDEAMRAQVVETIKNLLIQIKPQQTQNVKRLMDEVGLSTRGGSSNNGGNRDIHSEPRPRQERRQGNTNGHHSSSSHSSRSYYGNGSTPPSQQGFDSPDPAMAPFQQYGQGMMYGAAPGMPPAMNLQQLQYQQQMMGRGAPQMNYGYGGMQSNYGGFGAPGATIDPLRAQNMANGSPIQPSPAQMATMPGAQPSFAPPGFGMNMAPYGYGNMQGMQGMGYMAPEQHANTRRGRR